MGKFKSKKSRNDPLLVQLAEDKSVRQVPRRKDVRSGTLTEQNNDEVRIFLTSILLEIIRALFTLLTVMTVT